MGRGNGRPKVFKMRYRKPGKVFGTRFSLSNHSNGKLVGRILSVTKVSYEQLLGVGEYLPFDPDSLLEEFREVDNKKEVKV